MKFKAISLSMFAFSFVASTFAGSAKHEAPSPSTQILVVTTSDWNAVSGSLQRYERTQPGKGWKRVGNPITVVVGKTGLAWGTGLAPSNDPSVRGSSDPIKKEGDGKAPAGIFRLSTAFGYAAQPQAGWRMPYLTLTASVECVDDTASKSYNRIVDNKIVMPDWNSSEQMLRHDDLYRWGLVVDHNADPVTSGAGSCIFMHIWSGPGLGTVGCTAMPQDQLEAILAWLDPAKKPSLVQMPLPQYESLKKRWKLPTLPSASRPQSMPR